MQMLYNSDSYVVVRFDVGASPGATAEADARDDVPSHGPLTHGGYEIVDKFARKEIFLQGALAERFREGVETLIDSQPSEEEIDDWLAAFVPPMQQWVVQH